MGQFVAAIRVCPGLQENSEIVIARTLGVPPGAGIEQASEQHARSPGEVVLEFSVWWLLCARFHFSGSVAAPRLACHTNNG